MSLTRSTRHELLVAATCGSQGDTIGYSPFDLSVRVYSLVVRDVPVSELDPGVGHDDGDGSFDRPLVLTVIYE